MFLTGNFERSLDEKLRLALPKRIRELVNSKDPLVLTVGTDNSLALFTQAAFAAFAQKLAARSPTGHDVRAFSRLLFARSHSVEIDSQGRIRLPAELAQMAGLERDIMLLGVGDHMELWNKSRWEAYLADLTPRYDELAENALGDVPAGNSSSIQLPTLTAALPSQPR